MKTLVIFAGAPDLIKQVKEKFMEEYSVFHDYPLYEPLRGRGKGLTITQYKDLNPYFHGTEMAKAYVSFIKASGFNSFVLDNLQLQCELDLISQEDFNIVHISCCNERAFVSNGIVVKSNKVKCFSVHVDNPKYYGFISNQLQNHVDLFLPPKEKPVKKVSNIEITAKDLGDTLVFNILENSIIKVKQEITVDKKIFKTLLSKYFNFVDVRFNTNVVKFTNIKWNIPYNWEIPYNVLPIDIRDISSPPSKNNSKIKVELFNNFVRIYVLDKDIEREFRHEAILKLLSSILGYNYDEIQFISDGIVVIKGNVEFMLPYELLLFVPGVK